MLDNVFDYTPDDEILRPLDFQALIEPVGHSVYSNFTDIFRFLFYPTNAGRHSKQEGHKATIQFKRFIAKSLNTNQGKMISEARHNDVSPHYVQRL